MNDETILRARFHPRLPLYLVMAPAMVMILTVVGIPLLVFWIPLGIFWARSFVDRLTCRITAETLEIGKGVLFRKELTIPLDRLQEISLSEGPLQRYLGISELSFETAGGASPQQSSDLKLPGILHARQFRAGVLAQRDLVRSGMARAARAGQDPSNSVTESSGGTDRGDDGQLDATSVELLREIRDSLARMEERQSGLGV